MPGLQGKKKGTEEKVPRAVELGPVREAAFARYSFSPSI